MPWEQRNKKDLEDNIKHQWDHHLEIQTGLGTILETVVEILKIKTEEQQEDPMVQIDLEKKSRSNSCDTSGDRAINGRKYSKQKSNKYFE